jgi:hypothetical protein
MLLPRRPRAALGNLGEFTVPARTRHSSKSASEKRNCITHERCGAALVASARARRVASRRPSPAALCGDSCFLGRELLSPAFLQFPQRCSRMGATLPLGAADSRRCTSAVSKGGERRRLATYSPRLTTRYALSSTVRDCSAGALILGSGRDTRPQAMFHDLMSEGRPGAHHMMPTKRLAQLGKFEFSHRENPVALARTPH